MRLNRYQVTITVNGKTAHGTVRAMNEAAVAKMINQKHRGAEIKIVKL